MRGYFAPNRLDRIIANKAGLHPASLKDSEFTYEEIRRKLTVLVQEKRFLIYALLKTAPDHGFTHPEISAAIGTGGRQIRVPPLDALPRADPHSDKGRGRHSTVSHQSSIRVRARPVLHLSACWNASVP